MTPTTRAEIQAQTRQQDKRGAPSNGSEPWHGTLYGYNKLACRCAACRRAVKLYRRTQQRKIKPLPDPDPDYAGPIWRCPYCSVWKVRNGESESLCEYHGEHRVEMTPLHRTPPTPSPAVGTVWEDL